MCPPFYNYGFEMKHLQSICFTKSVNLRPLATNIYK